MPLPISYFSSPPSPPLFLPLSSDHNTSTLAWESLLDLCCWLGLVLVSSSMCRCVLTSEPQDLKPENDSPSSAFSQFSCFFLTFSTSWSPWLHSSSCFLLLPHKWLNLGTWALWQCCQLASSSLPSHTPSLPPSQPPSALPSFSLSL